MNEIVEQTKELALFPDFKEQLAEFKNRYDDVVYDLEIPEKLAEAKSDAHSIGKIISRLDAAHKAEKAPHKEKCDEIDHARKTLKDDFLIMQGKIRGPIKLRDQAIAEHAEMLQAKVDDIRNIVSECFNLPNPTAEEISAKLASVKALDVDDTYEDRKADATLAKVDAIQGLEELLADRTTYEAEQAELEKLRKEKEERERAEREEKIAKEAAEAATREAEAKALRESEEAEKQARIKAEAAERKAREATEEAERQVKEAEENAAKARQEEREKIEREQAEEAARVEAEVQAEEAKRDKRAHRSKIEEETVESLIKEVIFDSITIDKAGAEILVGVIRDKLIEHVSINY